MKTKCWCHRWSTSVLGLVPAPQLSGSSTVDVAYPPVHLTCNPSEGSPIPVIHSSKRHVRHHNSGIHFNNLTRIPLFHLTSSPANLFKLCTLNVRSLRNKSAALYDYVCDSKADLYAFTETWLTDKDSALIGDVVPTGYKFSHTPRIGRRGGGTALMFRDTLQVSKLDDGEKQSFEFSVHLVTLQSFQFRIINLYKTTLF